MTGRRKRSSGGVRLGAVLVLGLIAAAALAPSANARAHARKAIWGPVTVGGVSQFPIYENLGVSIFQMNLSWSDVAPVRPNNARDPSDPVYRWPAEIDQAISEGRAHQVTVALQVMFAPPWSNGGRPARYAPTLPADYADFTEAAARRYPDVRHWMIWGEPTRSDRFAPMARQDRPGAPLVGRERQGPRLYARLVDAAYGRLKALSRRNIVIGGNTFTTGTVSPRSFIRALKLPNGRAPRMDLYGHNPFTARRPDLRKPSLGSGYADFSDLDDLSRWIDQSLRRGKRHGPRLFLSEFFTPTDHANSEINLYVTPATQASWLRSALRISRTWRRIYALGAFLYDDPPRPDGYEVNRGLLRWDGRRKPAYDAFRNG
jgi:hypothetical protein